MVSTTRAIAATALTLAALTSCGKAAVDATPTHIYTPLPSFSTAAPTTSPSPVASPSESSKPSPQPSGSVTAVAAPATGTEAKAEGGNVQTEVPVEAPAVVEQGPPATGGAQATSTTPIVEAAPVQSTQRVSTTTTTVTTKTFAAHKMVVVTCKGKCDVEDFEMPQLTGEDGPFSLESVKKTLGAEKSHEGDVELQLTNKLIESMTKPIWDLDEKYIEYGQEKLVFTSAT